MSYLPLSATTTLALVKIAAMDHSTHIIDPDGEVIIVLHNANSHFAHPPENDVPADAPPEDDASGDGIMEVWRRYYGSATV